MEEIKGENLVAFAPRDKVIKSLGIFSFGSLHVLDGSFEYRALYVYI